MKTYAVEQGLKPLTRLAEEAKEKHRNAAALAEAHQEVIKGELDAIKKQIREQAKVQRGSPDSDGTLLEELARELAEKNQELQELKVTEPRYLTQDATVERLGELLRENPRGILVARDELAGWLRTMDKPGREGDREFYLEGWNGSGSYTFDRIGRGTVHIDAVTISICGGIQPGKLSAYIADAVEEGGGADGLLQRLQLLVWPDSLGEWKQADRAPDGPAQELAFRIFQVMDTLTASEIGAEQEDSKVPFLKFTTDAQGAFDDWRNKLENRLRSDELAPTPAFESHLSKYRSLMPSLALLFHLVNLAAETLLNGGAKSDESSSGTCGTALLGHFQENNPIPIQSAVSLQATELAIAWCDFLEQHARKVYARELNPGVEAAHSLGEKIEQRAVVDGSSVRDIYRHHWQGLVSSSQVDAALAVLGKAGWIQVETTETGGRPSETIRIHPQFYENDLV